MSPDYFITTTCLNRVGVLAAVTTALAELGGDMQYTAQSVVHGLFTMTVAARFPEHRTPDVIRDHLLDVGRPYQMEVLIRPMQFEAQTSALPGQRYFLSVSGQDAPGVVRTICAMLAQELIEIERLFAVPDTPGTFSMVIILNMPHEVDLLSLNGDLEMFAALNGLSIMLQHENHYNASTLPRNIAPGMISGAGPVSS